MKKSKKYIDASKLYDKTAVYEFEEAVALVKKMSRLYPRNQANCRYQRPQIPPR